MDKLSNILFLLLLISVRFISVSGQICAPATSTGPNSLLKKRDKVDTNTARTYVHTDMQYMFKCCGVVEQWKLFAKNSGNITLQVWRPIGSTLKLVGENKFSISTEGSKTLPVPVGDRITVQYSDYIGWTSDAKMITYTTSSASDAFSLEISYDAAFYSGGNVADWRSSTAHSNRLYAVVAVATANSVPYLSDLSTPREYFQADLQAKDSVLVAYTHDVDSSDFSSMSYIRLDSYGMYFDMNIKQNSTHAYAEFVIANIPPVANYTLQFEVQDICFNSVLGTVQVVIKYRQIAIQSLPNDVTIHTHTPAPVALHTLVVLSDLVFGCTIKAVDPAVPDGTFIIDTGQIAVVDPSRLSAPMTYNVDIACSDSWGTEDVKTLTVNCVSNNAPRINGFFDSVMVDTMTTNANDVILSYAVIDDEGDVVSILSYCDQNPCPFELLNTADVICTGELKDVNDTKFTIHFGLTDGYLISNEYVLNIYIQNINLAPYISNLLADQKNTIILYESAEVGAVVFDANGVDENPLDVLAFTAEFYPPEGKSYFAFSVTDGSFVLLATLNYSLLEQANMTVFGANVSVSDGQTSSDVYNLEMVILPGAFDDNSVNGESSSTSGKNAQARGPSLTIIVLASALGLFVLMSLALCVMLIRMKTRGKSESLNSSTADLLTMQSRFRVVQVEPAQGTDPIAKISRPRMSLAD